jgi:hypothetical protein
MRVVLTQQQQQQQQQAGSPSSPCAVSSRVVLSAHRNDDSTNPDTRYFFRGPHESPDFHAATEMAETDMDHSEEMESEQQSALADQALSDHPPASSEKRARETGGTPIVHKHAAVFPRAQKEVQPASPLSAARPRKRSPPAPLTHMGSYPRDNPRTEHRNPPSARLTAAMLWRRAPQDPDSPSQKSAPDRATLLAIARAHPRDPRLPPLRHPGPR